MRADPPSLTAAGPGAGAAAGNCGSARNGRRRRERGARSTGGIRQAGRMTTAGSGRRSIRTAFDQDGGRAGGVEGGTRVAAPASAGAAGTIVGDTAAAASAAFGCGRPPSVVTCSGDPATSSAK